MRRPTQVILDNKSTDFNFQLFLSLEGDKAVESVNEISESPKSPFEHSSDLFSESCIELAVSSGRRCSSEKDSVIRAGERKTLFVINPKSESFTLCRDDQSIYATIHMFPKSCDDEGDEMILNTLSSSRRRLTGMQQSYSCWPQLKICLSGKEGHSGNPRLLYGIAGEPTGSVYPDHEWKMRNSSRGEKSSFFLAKFRCGDISFLFNYRLYGESNLYTLEYIVFQEKLELTTKTPIKASANTSFGNQSQLQQQQGGGSRLSLILSASSGLGNNRFVVYDEVFENQRGSCLLGRPRFSSNSLFPTDRSKWSNREGKFMPDVKYLELPNPNWTWVTGWTIDLKYMDGLGPEGWMYALNWNTGWSSQHSITSCVRRRRWIRGRQKTRDSSTTCSSVDTLSIGSASASHDRVGSILDRLRAGRVDRERKQILVEYIKDHEKVIAAGGGKIEKRLLHILSYFEYESSKVDICNMLFPLVKNTSYKLQALSHLTFFSDRELLAEKFSLSPSVFSHHIKEIIKEDVDEDFDYLEEDVDANEGEGEGEEK